MATRPPVATLLEQIRDGKTYRELGTEYGVSHGTICNWLAEADQSVRAQALLDSAEPWLDKGIAYLESALSKESGIDAGAARALAQECARRAAIRNPRYRDNTKVELSGDPERPIEQKWTLEIVRPATQDATGSVSPAKNAALDL